MPYLTITSNQRLDTDSNQLSILSKTVAHALNKPVSSVMISVHHNPVMLFAGTSEPLAYCELKSLGLQESQTSYLSQILCQTLDQLFNIPKTRIYMEFSASARHMWGWDSKTF